MLHYQVVRTAPRGATLSNKMNNTVHYGHVRHTLALMCAKNHLLTFSSFLDIWENVEWPRFFGPPCTFVTHLSGDGRPLSADLRTGRAARGPINQRAGPNRSKAALKVQNFKYSNSANRRVWTLVNRWQSDRFKSQQRFDYDTTTTKNWHVHFLLASNGSRRARYFVVGS